MNEPEAIQTEIETVANAAHEIIVSRYLAGWKTKRNVTKKSIRELTALGIEQDAIPNGDYQEVVDAVIAAAKDAGKTVKGHSLNEDGDSWTWASEPSALWMLLNPVQGPEPAPETSDQGITVPDWMVGDIKTREDGAEVIQAALFVHERAVKARASARAFKKWNFVEHDSLKDWLTFWEFETDREVQRELCDLGEKYFAEGYRLHYGSRRSWGVEHIVPSEAIAWRVILSGDIGGMSQERLQYVIPPALHQVLTTAEAEARHGLAEGSAKKAIQRGQVPGTKRGKTWFIYTTDADAEWGC